MVAEAANGQIYPGAAVMDMELLHARAQGTNTKSLPKFTTNGYGELQEAITLAHRVELGVEPDHSWVLVPWGAIPEILHAAGKVHLLDVNTRMSLPRS